MNAQAEAFTASELPCPRCFCQSAPAMRSSISASAVAASGMRSSASARQSSATPSAVPRPYSARKSVTSAPGLCAPRAACTSERARTATPGGDDASASSGASTSGSGARWRRRRRALSSRTPPSWPALCRPSTSSLPLTSIVPTHGWLGLHHDEPAQWNALHRRYQRPAPTRLGTSGRNGKQLRSQIWPDQACLFRASRCHTSGDPAGNQHEALATRMESSALGCSESGLARPVPDAARLNLSPT